MSAPHVSLGSPQGGSPRTLVPRVEPAISPGWGMVTSRPSVGDGERRNFVRPGPPPRSIAAPDRRICFKRANNMLDITTVIRDPRGRFYGDAATSFIGGKHVGEFDRDEGCARTERRAATTTLARCN